MHIAALVFEFYNPILTNKIHCTYHKKIMQAANKTNKNERGIGGGGGGRRLNLASLNCAFLPRACKYELQVIFYFEAALLQHYIARFFEESIFLYIGQSCDNSFDNKKR